MELSKSYILDTVLLSFYQRILKNVEYHGVSEKINLMWRSTMNADWSLSIMA